MNPSANVTIAISAEPVFIDIINIVESISSSPSTKLSGVESISLISLILLEFVCLLISEIFSFSPTFAAPFHLKISFTTFVSPGCINSFSNKFVATTLSPTTVHPSLSLSSNVNPAGM